jgi:hypothetical protein
VTGQSIVIFTPAVATAPTTITSHYLTFHHCNSKALASKRVSSARQTTNKNRITVPEFYGYAHPHNAQKGDSIQGEAYAVEIYRQTRFQNCANTEWHSQVGEC